MTDEEVKRRIEILWLQYVPAPAVDAKKGE